MPPRKQPQWVLLFPRFRCPHCKKAVGVKFYGRYRFTGLRTLARTAFADRKTDP
jgi:hypothetical protein